MPLPIKRSDAKAQGLTRYFTGKPCAHGHVEERMTSSGACLMCHMARRSQWEADNREKLNAKQRLRNKASPGLRRAASALWREKNAEKRAAKQRQYRIANLTKETARQARWLAENPDKMRAINSAWYQKNPHVVTLRDARRRAAEARALAAWDTELTELVAYEAALVARARELCTGFAWHVDHMIPLRAKKASGLHTWANLQVIPMRLNLRKGNHMWLVERGEWVLHA